MKDLQLLSDSSRELQALTASEDPVSSLSQYGTISNPAVKRRTNRRPPPAPATMPAVQPKAKSVEAKSKEAPKVKAEPKSSQPSSAKDFFGKGKEKTKTENGGGSKESTPAPVALKKESSSLFKSFAKAKPKLQRNGTDSSAVASAAEDEPMKDVSDDEEETYVPPVNEIVDSDRKSRKEREAALKKMMEDDEEDAEAVPTPEEEPDEEEDAEVLEEVIEKKEPEPVVEVKDGRRRGRRRVMKKKTVRDDEGYLGSLPLALFVGEMLTWCSDQGRSCLGILLRGRASATSETEGPGSFNHIEDEEVSCEDGTRGYYVVLREKIMGYSRTGLNQSITTLLLRSRR